MTVYNRFVSLDLVEEVEVQFSECRLDQRASTIVKNALFRDKGGDATVHSLPPMKSSSHQDLDTISVRRTVRTEERVRE